MDHKQTTLKILATLQKDHLFTDAQKAEVFSQIIDEMPEEDLRQILNLFKKS